MGQSRRLRPCRGFLLVILLLTGCAQPEAPSGGPLDKEKPRVIGMTPDSAATGVLPDTISILFSKAMDHGSVRDWLFVTPALRIAERRWEGERCDLILAAPPESGRTYSILLGSEVIDKRGNELGPWQTSFCSGSRIDDGIVEGKVQGGRLRGGGLYLYAWSWRDSIDFTGSELPPPLRMGQAGKDGSFQLTALPREKPLRLCALYDVKRNRSYEPEEDLWGCVEIPIVFTDTTRTIRDLEVYVVLPDEPGLVQGLAVDSSCVGTGEGQLALLAREADSLSVLIGLKEAAQAETLLAFQSARPVAADSAAVRVRLAMLDSLTVLARADSFRCSRPVIVRLLEGDTTLVGESRSTGSYSFGDVAPGVYRIEAFRDLDEDGRRGEAEPSGRYPHAIEVRPGRQLKDLNLFLE